MSTFGSKAGATAPSASTGSCETPSTTDGCAGGSGFPRPVTWPRNWPSRATPSPSPTNDSRQRAISSAVSAPEPSWLPRRRHRRREKGAAHRLRRPCAHARSGVTSRPALDRAEARRLRLQRRNARPGPLPPRTVAPFRRRRAAPGHPRFRRLRRPGRASPGCAARSRGTSASHARWTPRPTTCSSRAVPSRPST